MDNIPKLLTTITARIAGRDRHDNPHPLRQFVVDERREAACGTHGTSGTAHEQRSGVDGHTRIFVLRPDLDARPGQQCFAPEVVLTDSIVEALPGPGCVRVTDRVTGNVWQAEVSHGEVLHGDATIDPVDIGARYTLVDMRGNVVTNQYHATH